MPQWRLWDSTSKSQRVFDIEYKDGIVQEVTIDEMPFMTMEPELDLDDSHGQEWHSPSI